MSKSSILALTFALIFGVPCSVLAQQPPISGSANGYGTSSGAASDPFAGAPGMGTSTRPQKPSASDASDTANDTDDESLTRLKTKDSLGAGGMSRDEGQLTAKQRRREKVLKVESTKQLPTSGTDPKFQGSLLHSGVTSIEDVGAKANSEDKANAENEVKDEGDPRFKAKRLVFSPSTENESKTTKKESPRTEADSSPSPSPSPSASATPSSH